MQPDPAPKFLVLGARGQLGREFLRVLGSQALGLDRAQLDLSAPAALERVLGQFHPEVVINATAYNQVDLAETERQQALAVNFEAPAALARLAAAHGCKLLHFSTDYVFGGDGLQRPRVETDAPVPVNFYGHSKLLGEQAVLGSDAQALVARVAHLYGGESLSPGRANLVTRFLQQARAGESIWVAPQQTLNPTSVRDLVPACLSLLERGERGLFHLTGEGECGSLEFVRELLHLAGLKAKIQLVTEDHRPARRAPYTVLANQRWALLGRSPLPHWRESLAASLAASV